MSAESRLQSTKSLLAKLLATENITISHLPVKTASFDINSRSLVCPIWKDMDGDLYDLLLGREVGHALETPTQGWKEALIDDDGNPMPEEFEDCLSVLEDARIEKKIKRRYPGISKSFFSAYKSLYENDYFGIRQIDLNALNFIDRINIYSKIGSHVIVPWKNDWERDIIKEVEELETWKQVVELAKKIFEYMKEEHAQICTEEDLTQFYQESKNEESNSEQEEDEEELSVTQKEDTLDNDTSGVDQAGSPEEEPLPVEIELQKETEKEIEIQNQEIREEIVVLSSESNSEETLTEQIQAAAKKIPCSVTHRAFKNRESELVNHDGKVYFLNLPEANLENIIMTNELVLNDLEKFIQSQLDDSDLPYGKINMTYDQLASKCVREFNSRNKKFIMHIFKEFDMRKRARDYARTSVSRIGELDMNVLYKYKYSSDLFKKMTTVEKGKNHGLVLFVDMSGSMQKIFKNTVEQTLVLVSFCKLANIPFEVYAFSNNHYKHQFLHKSRNKQFTSNPNFELSMIPYDFHLKHLIGSSLKSSDYRRSFNALAIIINEYNAAVHDQSSMTLTGDNGNFQSDWTSAGLGLHGTPYIETLLSSREMIKQFRSSNKLDIVNVIYLTDGVGNTNLVYPKSFNPSMLKSSIIYFVDKKSQTRVKLNRQFENEQVAVTKLVKEVTKCKHLGFYLVDRQEMTDILSNIRYGLESGIVKITQSEFDKMRKSAKENNFFSAQSIGYDRYFFIGSSTTNIQEEEIAVSCEMQTEEMSRIFNRVQNSKKNSRILVTKFAEELASGL